MLTMLCPGSCEHTSEKVSPELHGDREGALMAVTEYPAPPPYECVGMSRPHKQTPTLTGLYSN